VFPEDDTWTNSNHVHWDCGQNGSHQRKFNRIPTDQEWRDYCGDTHADGNATKETYLAAVIYFPQCRQENGPLDSTNFRDHVIHAETDRPCPAPYDKRMPQLGYLVYWDMTDFRNGVIVDGEALSMNNLRLSSDPVFSITGTTRPYTAREYDGDGPDDRGGEDPANIEPLNPGSYRFVVEPDINGNNIEKVPGGTLHGDWVAGWNQEIMRMWIDNCNKDRVNCSVGETGTKLRLRRQPGNYEGHPDNRYGTGTGSYLIPTPDGSMRGSM